MAAGKPNDSEYPPYEGLIDGASSCLLTLNNGEDGVRHGSEENLAIPLSISPVGSTQRHVGKV